MTLSWTLNDALPVTPSADAAAQIAQWADYFTNIATDWEIVDSNSDALMLKPRQGDYINDRFIITRNTTGHILDPSNAKESLSSLESYVYGIYCHDSGIVSLPDLTAGAAMSGGYAGGAQSSATVLYACSSNSHATLRTVTSSDTLFLCIGNGSDGASPRAISYVGRCIEDPIGNHWPTVASLGPITSMSNDSWTNATLVQGRFLPCGAANFNEAQPVTQAKGPNDSVYLELVRNATWQNLSGLKTPTNNEILDPIIFGKTQSAHYAGHLRQAKVGRDQLGEGLVVGPLSEQLAVFVSRAGPNGTAGNTIYFTESE